MSGVSSWSVADFKSLGSARLGLPNLTILSGANSSGKSSVLQSLLLLGQSSNRGGLALNGQLVRLGTPEDVVRDGQEAIQLGFDVGYERAASARRIGVSISLKPDRALSTLVPATYEVVGPEGEILLEATATRTSIRDQAFLRREFGSAELSVLRIANASGKQAPNRSYLLCVGLIPLAIASHLSEAKIERSFARLFREIQAGARPVRELHFEAASVVNKRDFLTKHSDKSSEEREVRGVRRSFAWHPRDFEALPDSALSSLQAEVVSARKRDGWVIGEVGAFYSPLLRSRSFMHGRDGVLERELKNDNDALFQGLFEVASAIQDLGSNLQYLGPLRDEPKVVHGVWDERNRAIPVGIKGELTADVLTRERDSPVRYRTPELELRTASLTEAVSEWCAYLGIGDSIKVQDLGKLGRSVTLSVDGKPRDLTMIGVGASQLLPILVAGLAAPADAIMLIEQPELHLHPSVQARLADFFLFARPNVRFLVETHSEYLITRVRRRVAEEAVEPGALEVQFAERFGGVTKLRALELTKLGDFEEWPDGFFDEQEKDSHFIMRAIAKAMKGEK